MNESHYGEYEAYKASGRKADAAIALERFIDSISPEDDRAAWVRRYLEAGSYGHRIPHRLYKTVIFPVLSAGADRHDAWSLLWLANTAQNLYTAPRLHEAVGYRTSGNFLREAYDLMPTDEIRGSLLADNIRWFDYSQHEWPSGILYGTNGATVDECNLIEAELRFTRNIDTEGKFSEYLDAFEVRLLQYRARLAK